MRNGVMAEIVITLGLIFIIPFVFIGGALAAVWVITLSPFLLVAFLLFMLARKIVMDKGWFKNIDIKIPSCAKPIKPRAQKKPIMVNWMGKNVPLSVLVFSVIFSVLFFPFLIIAMILWIPWIWSVAIILVLIGVQIGKSSK